MSSTQQTDDRSVDWPVHLDRTPPAERKSYPSDLSLTRKESFQSVVDELKRWGATAVSIEMASHHYADRPNIPISTTNPTTPAT
ncbi:hypothetical protein [Halosolutus halophilus]|uniref:hypothetical protein n=1 Tax=Halosolutus halophilus TaxID=1552990 RepID=UPI002235057E|nr:hypothetical protein [Halosolutus halophilus]